MTTTAPKLPPPTMADPLPVLSRDCLDGRPLMLTVDYHGDRLLLDATGNDPDVYAVGWLSDGVYPLAEAAAEVRRWYGTVPVAKVWPDKRRRAQRYVDGYVVGRAFRRTIIGELPDSRRRAIYALLGTEL